MPANNVLAKVTEFGSRGFGFAQALNGQKYYFALPGYAHGRVDFRMQPGEVIEVLEKKDIPGQSLPAAWRWDSVVGSEAEKFLAEFAKTDRPVTLRTMKPTINSTAKPIPRMTWHIHGIVDEWDRETGQGDIALVGQSTENDKFEFSEGDRIGFTGQGYCNFEGDVYSPAKLAKPIKGEEVVVLTTRNRLTAKGEETDEVIAWKWCRLSDFPAHLCGSDRPGAEDEVETVIENQSEGFRVVTSDNTIVKTGTLRQLADLLAGEAQDDKHVLAGPALQLAIGQWHIDQRLADGQWVKVDKAILPKTKAIMA